MDEFTRLFQIMNQSGCAKKQTAAGTYVNGVWYYAVNFCEYQGDDCPRLHMPSGTGYELCKANHAEANLSKQLQELNVKTDGIVWLTGHYWACEPCASSLKLIGIKELRIKEVE